MSVCLSFQKFSWRSSKALSQALRGIKQRLHGSSKSDFERDIKVNFKVRGTWKRRMEEPWPERACFKSSDDLISIWWSRSSDDINILFWLIPDHNIFSGIFQDCSWQQTVPWRNGEVTLFAFDRDMTAVLWQHHHCTGREEYQWQRIHIHRQLIRQKGILEISVTHI